MNQVLLILLTLLFSAPERNRPAIISCAPSSNDEYFTDDNGKFIPVLPGWGNYKYRITTNSDSSQFYFNQGLNLYYSYHLKQAVASFKEAARFDPQSPMTYWGQALAMGPFYNEPVYKMNKTLPGIIEQMMVNSPNGSTKEKHMIGAMRLRYSNDTSNADRKELDKNYADALKNLVTRYPDDKDIKALYVDAIMLQHKWDFWNNDGTPKVWTPEAVSVCESVLQADSVHPAAMHYYIHLVEASRNPSRALKSAEYLRDALPGVSHMVHMASHMYQRNGLFSEGVFVNERANEVSNHADSISPINGSGQNTTIHYFAVQSYCAMTAGMYKSAMPVYMRARKRVLELNGPLHNLPYQQFVYMMPVMAAVRMGEWKDVLDAAPVDRSWKYALILESFAKGMAYVRTGDLRNAEASVISIENALTDSTLQIRRVPFNKPVQGATIALHLLTAEILAAKSSHKEALEHYQQAILEEDKLIYAEPQDWLIPSRQFLGQYYLNRNQYAQAEKILREDLLHHPGNGWAMAGLQQSLIRQKKYRDAGKYDTAIKSAFRKADVPASSAVF